MKVCVFVDGENFRHSICDLYPEFKKEEYLPKKADWGALFDWIVEKAVPGGERIRTYWYVIEKVSYTPFNLPNTAYEPKDPSKPNLELIKILSKSKIIKEELAGITDVTALKKRMADLSYELKERMTTFDKRFDGWTTIQNGIALKHRCIEFRRAGCIRYNLFDADLGQEKAVDVKLACDLITLSDMYDTAIIVSGDQDYVPAVMVVKDYGKRVVNVSFLTRSGITLPGGARQLNQITDWSLNLEHNELAGHLQITSGIP